MREPDLTTADVARELNASTETVRARTDPGDIARGLNGVPLTLLVDGQPIRAIVRTEIGSIAAEMQYS